MSSLFSAPKIPASAAVAPTNAPAYQAPPQRADAEVQAAVASDRSRRAAMRGRGSTLLTGDDTAIGDRRKTLLGE